MDAMSTHNMTKRQLSQVDELVSKHYRVFSSNKNYVYYSDKVPHKIALTYGFPVRLPHRRIPAKQWEEVKEYVDAHLEAGIIRPSTSPYTVRRKVVRWL